MKSETIISLLILLAATGRCDRIVVEPALQTFIGTLEAYALTPNAVVFVVDESGSIGSQTYEEVKHFTNLIARRFSVSSEHSRVAVVSFANNPRIHANYIKDSNGNNMCTLLKVVDGMDYVGEGTHTSVAMEKAREILVQARPEAKKIIILITDGMSNYGYSPLEAARRLRREGVIIFAVGVADVNKEEVEGIATSKDHIYILTDFDLIKQLNKYLKNETKEVSWDYTQDTSMCDSFCPNKANCCDQHAKCYCGTRGGDYECVCDAGYQGSGHQNECLMCPKGTYKSTLDHEGCKKCPEHSTTSSEGSTSFADCECEIGYEKTGNYCKAVECSHLGIPEGGILIPTNCNNTYGSKCTLRCKEGFCPYSCQLTVLDENPSILPWNRTPLPSRQCLETGKWSGQDFYCEKMWCPVLDPPLNGKHNCSGIHSGFGTSCHFECNAGYDSFGSSIRTCLVNGTWTGITTHCKEILCDPLKRNQHLKVKPSKCGSALMPFKSVCRYYCTDGYSLVSDDGLNDGINECLANKTWSSASTKISCRDISPPSIKCPNSIVTNTDPLKATATVTWDEATASDNVFVSEVSVKHPPSVRKPPHSFPIGTTKVVYEAFDSSNHSSTCSFTVTVLDKEPPRVVYCPENIEIYHQNKSLIEVNWTEPEFVDNSNKLGPPIHNRNSGDEFSWGEASLVFYNVSDPSGNTASCRFTVKVKRYSCPPFDPPANGLVTCDKWEDGRLCSVFCMDGFTFASKYKVPSTYECKIIKTTKTESKWVPFLGKNPKFTFPVPDCSRKTKRSAINVTVVYNYNVDTCNDKIVEEMRKKFIHTLKHSFGSAGSVICPVNRGCMPGNVNISCGDPLLRIRRSLDTLRKVLKIKFSVELYPDKDETIDFTTKEPNAIKTELSQTLLPQIQSLVSENVREVYNVTSIDAPQTNYEIDLICSLGQVRNNDSCVDCPPGTFKDDFTEACIDCPFATYQNKENSFSCLPCPLGHTTYDKRSKSFSDCKAPCKPGTYSRTTFEPCQLCPLNTYQEGTGNKECFKCPNQLLTWTAGTNSSKNCASPCKPGSYSDTGLEPCSLCDFGLYQSRSQQKSCEICPVGTTTKSKGSENLNQCKKVNHCEELQPCSNSSTCMQLENGYMCVCLPGTFGKHCEDTTDFCESDSCFNGGVCINAVDGYKCLCPDGFSGLNCEINFDDCQKDSCNNNGECIDLVNDYTCSCHAGYTGSKCEINIFDCLPDSCGNGGTCFDKVNAYKCCCPEGYTGENCERKLNPCDDVACENDGICTSDETEFTCACKPGFVGTYCEEKIDQCLNQTCFNNGSCKNGVCQCPLGYAGSHCEEEHTPEYYLSFKTPTTSNYVKLENTKFLYAITISFFMRTDLKDPKRRPTVVSYSYYNKENKELVDNALTLFDLNRLVLYLHGDMLHTGYIANSDSNWHHYAVTWEGKDGKWSFIVDGKVIVEGSHVGDGKLFWPGFFVIGQEQDSLGGTFSTSEAFAGDITEFNVWNYALSSEEIALVSSSCGIIGNVLQWVIASQHVHGSVIVSKDNYVCKNIGYCSKRDCHCFYSTEDTADICKHSVQDCSSNTCDNLQACVVDASRFYCRCDTGYEGRLCEYDLNECLEDNGGCSHICVNTLGSYQCECPDGMLLSSDDLSCIDTSFCKVTNQIYLDGESWTSNCQNCLCKQGNVECLEIKCPVTKCLPEENWVHLPGECCPKCTSYAFCFISSNNTLATFEYTSMDLSPVCDFALVEDCVNGLFSVRLESEQDPFPQRNLILHQHCQQLRLSKTGEVFVNNNSVALPFKNGEFMMESTNGSVDIWSKSGLYLRWHLQGEVLIAVPSEIAASLCGLCGVYQEHHIKKNTSYNYTEESPLEKQACIIQKEDQDTAYKSHGSPIFAAGSVLQVLVIFSVLHLMSFYH